MQEKTRKDQLRDLITQAVNQGVKPWAHNERAQHIYAHALLRELLVYSALDQMEIWQHLEYLIQKDSDPQDTD